MNIRGFDIPFNPMIFSYAVITPDEVHFFVEDKKLTPEIKEHLKDVKIHSYESIGSWLKDYHEKAKSNSNHKVGS